ncbi:MAG: hypothetical protein JW807_12385 [Spirochaetes bacterium]|nr:hypothetical protein [Spirochaetota bacterium]
MKRFALFCIVPVPVFPEEARVSQVHFEKISLERLIEMSPIIALVRKNENKYQERCFQPPCSIEPYRYGEYRYWVLKMLRGGEGLSPETEISVTNFDPASLKAHLDFHAQGLSRSPVAECYEPDGSFSQDRETETIIFLKRSIFILRDAIGKLNAEVDDLTQTCVGAIESPEKMEAIVRLIKNSPAQSRVEISIGISAPIPENEKMEIFSRLKSMFPGYASYAWKAINISPDCP